MVVIFQHQEQLNSWNEFCFEHSSNKTYQDRTNRTYQDRYIFFSHFLSVIISQEHSSNYLESLTAMHVVPCESLTDAEDKHLLSTHVLI